MNAGIEAARGLRFLVIQDHRENRRKCSLTPLEGRADVRFVRLEQPSRALERIEVGSGILLHLDGPPLTVDDVRYLGPEGPDGWLVVLDSTWARLPKLESRIVVSPGARLERRSLPAGIQTAYPRVSKVFDDPRHGLASIEALFAATAILTPPRFDLLEGYRWRDEFLLRNGYSDVPLATRTASRVS